LRDLLRGGSVCLMVAVVVGVLGGCGQQPVALVNGQKITRTEFITRLKKAAGKAVLADLIFRRLVEDEFQKAGLQLTDQEVNERLSELKKEFPNEEAFQQWVQSIGMTPQELTSELRYQLKLEKLRTKDVKFTEADLKRFFKDHREHYDKPERVIVSQIVVGSKSEAEKVRAELKKPGANFGALARQYSIDPMFRSRGGRLPEMPLRQLMPPEVQAAVAKMKVGDISQPIKVDQNWYIVKLEDRKPAEKATFEKVRKQVERDYRMMRATPKETLYRNLAQSAVVQVLDPDLAEVQEMFVPKGKLPEFGGKKPSAAGGKPSQGQGTAGQGAAGSAPSGQPAGTAGSPQGGR